MVCPRCDGQGVILRVRVPELNAQLFLCDECDATWHTQDAVGVEMHVDFQTYMDTLGIKSAWSKIEILGQAGG